MNRSSFGYAVVNEDDLATASVVGCGKEHTLRVDVADTVGLEVGDDNDLSADQLLGRIFLFDRGHDHALTDAVKQRELETGVRLAHPLGFEDLANTEVELCKIVDRDLLFDRLHRIGLTVFGGSGFFGAASFFGQVSFEFFLGLRVGEIKQTNVFFGLNGVEEQIETRSLFLVDEELVDRAEERALNTLELLVGHFGAVHSLGDRIKLGVQLVQRVATLCNVGVEQLDLLLFLV